MSSFKALASETLGKAVFIWDITEVEAEKRKMLRSQNNKLSASSEVGCNVLLSYLVL